MVLMPKYSPEELAQVLQKQKPYLVDIERALHTTPYGMVSVELTTYNGHVVRLSHISKKEIKYEIPKAEYNEQHKWYNLGR